MRNVVSFVARRLAVWADRTIAVAARPLLTPREADFCRLLRAAAAPLHVAPQVAMAALLAADHGGVRPDRRIVDFVLIDDGGGVALIVELDDRTHDRVRDRRRDAETAAAGYRTLRVNGVTARDPRLLTDAVDAALGRPRRWSPPVAVAKWHPWTRPPPSPD